MSETELRAMIDQAAAFCRHRYAKHGQIAAMWHMVTSSGETVVALHPPFESKNLANAFMRAQMEFRDVVRCVFVSEGWYLGKQALNEMDAAKVRAITDIQHHPDRVEAILLKGEDYACGEMMAVLPVIGKRKLGPLDVVVEPDGRFQAEGRIVGMLPRRGSRQ